MKQNVHVRPGSAILLVLLVMSAIIFCGFNLFKSSVLTAELVLLRQDREKKLRAAEGILNYGIALCTQRWRILQQKAKKEKKTWSFWVGDWQLNKETTAHGQLHVDFENNQATLTASLVSPENPLFGLGCTLVQKSEKKGEKTCNFFEVKDWKEISSKHTF